MAERADKRDLKSILELEKLEEGVQWQASMRPCLTTTTILGEPLS